MSNTYQNGDEIVFYGTFKNAAGVERDPTNVFFQIKNPAGTITTYQYGEDVALKRESTGVYYIELSVTTSGHWHYRWYSTGVGMASDEAGIYVEESEFV